MITATVILIAELTVLFVGVAFGVELLQRRLGPERLKAWMGGTPVTAALKGIAVGFVTPFCTYSAVPLLIGLRRAGVPTAGFVAFIVAAPVLDPVLFGALALIVGLDIAIAYLVVAFTAALTLALAAERIGIDHHLKELPTVRSRELVATGIGQSTPICDQPSGEFTQCETAADSHEEWNGIGIEAATAAKSTAALARSFGPLLLAGVAIGLAIDLFVSPDTAAAITGNNGALSIPIAAALGTPLYFSTELFIPIADALSDAGVGTGAIVALTIAGAGANLPEFVILTRLARRRLIVIFFAYVFLVATLGGVLAEAIAT